MQPRAPRALSLLAGSKVHQAIQGLLALPRGPREQLLHHLRGFVEEGPAAELIDAQPSEPWAQVAEGLVGLLRAQGASRARAAHLGPKGQDHLSVFGPYVGFEAYVYIVLYHIYHNIV